MRKNSAIPEVVITLIAIFSGICFKSLFKSFYGLFNPYSENTIFGVVANTNNDIFLLAYMSFLVIIYLLMKIYYRIE